MDNKEIIMGIYEIKNKENGKVYIGSSKNIYKRWREHSRMLKNGSHHSWKLQDEWNKYNKEAFVFSIIEKVNDYGIDLLELEQKYIDNYKSYESTGYNVAKSTKQFGVVSDDKYSVQEFFKSKGFIDELEQYRNMESSDLIFNNVYEDDDISKTNVELIDICFDLVNVYKNILAKEIILSYRYEDCVLYCDKFCISMFSICNKTETFLSNFLSGMKIKYIKIGDFKLLEGSIKSYEIKQDDYNRHVLFVDDRYEGKQKISICDDYLD